MAKSPNFITGLDIGTSAVKIAVVQKKSDGEGLEAIFAGQKPSRGIRRGVITDAEAVSRCISDAVKDAELSIGQRIEQVFTSVNGSHIFCTPSHGLVSVSRADSNISEEDVGRVMQAAKTISLSSNKEVINVYPREFVVDGESGVKDAVGMRGLRLEAQVLVVAGFSPYLKNSDSAVLKSNLEILDRMPAVIASAAAVLTGKQKELGVAIIDIGAGTTNVAVYEEGDLLHLAVLPIGSSNITNDLAIGLKADIEIAERLKIEKGTCLFKGGDKKIKIEIDGNKNDATIFSQRVISKIIQERTTEIFELVAKELKKIGRDKKLPGGVILTGGGAKLPKIEELAKRVFQLTVNIGGFEKISGSVDDPALAAACGLAVTGWEDIEEIGGTRPAIGAGWGDKMKKFFRIFIP